MKPYIKTLVVIPSLLIINSSCQKDNSQMGTYGYDKTFFEKQNIDFVELGENNDLAKLLVVPAYQGRVMTSTAGFCQAGAKKWVIVALPGFFNSEKIKSI